MYPQAKSRGKDKSPYNRREEKDDKKAFKSVTKSVKPVAEDTNKTRRKMVKPTAVGKKIPKKGAPTGKPMHGGGMRRIKQHKGK